MVLRPKMHFPKMFHHDKNDFLDIEMCNFFFPFYRVFLLDGKKCLVTNNEKKILRVFLKEHNFII